MSRYRTTRGAALGRAAVALIGGYALAFAFSLGSTAVLARAAGLARADAFVVSAMFAFVVWTIAVLVAYAAASARRAAAWVLGSAAALAGIGWVLSPLPASV